MSLSILINVNIYKILESKEHRASINNRMPIARSRKVSVLRNMESENIVKVREELPKAKGHMGEIHPQVIHASRIDLEEDDIMDEVRRAGAKKIE